MISTKTLFAAALCPVLAAMLSGCGAKAPEVANVAPQNAPAAAEQAAAQGAARSAQKRQTGAAGQP